MPKKFSTPFIAFLQATGLAVYIVLISLFFNFAEVLFKNNAVEFYAPIVMLLLFIISAVICALLFLGKAGVLFWEKRYKESFTLIGWTLGWALLYFFLIILTIPIM